MDKFKTLKIIKLGFHHIPTGNTRHYANGQYVNNIVELKIVQYLGDSAYYLYYCNNDGEWITDTLHNTLEGAMDQAEFEFNVKLEEWEDA